MRVYVHTTLSSGSPTSYIFDRFEIDRYRPFLSCFYSLLAVIIRLADTYTWV